MGVTTMKMTVASTHNGQSVAGFPDVCKTPSPGGPVPIPYPNLASAEPQTAGSKAPAGRVVSDKTLRSHLLRDHLQSLHMQIWSLPGGNPNRWHKLLDDYVIATAELYKTLSE